VSKPNASKFTKTAGERIRELEEENARLKREQKNAQFEFRSELEEVIRAQLSLECCYRLVKEIDRRIFSTNEKGREIISEIKDAIRSAQNQINQQWRGLGLSDGKGKTDTQTVMQILKEIEQIGNEHEEEINLD
jgi:uncharacterized protein YgfB (UPF0149 family)